MTTRLARCALLLLAGCTPPPPPAPAPAVADYPGELVPTSAMGPDFLAQQQVSGRYKDQDFQFSAALQKRGGSLKVVGLTPFSTKAFLLEQRGVEVTFQPFTDRPPPFPPRYMLQDIHRTFFAALAAPRPDGEHREEREGELVIEQWQGGKLLRRSFRRLDGKPPGEIRVDYGEGLAPRGPLPPSVTFENGWFGYRLAIETGSYQALLPHPQAQPKPPPAPPPKPPQPYPP